jgi:hypothetical protein
MSSPIQYDVAGTHTAIVGTASSVVAIKPYVTAVIAIPLGARPIVIDGQNAGSWDPLAKTPAIKTAIASAQQHARSFQGSVIDNLHNVPGLLKIILGLKKAGLSYNLALLETLINQLDGKPPSQAQRQEIKQALDDVLELVKGIDIWFSRMPASIDAFTKQMTGDAQALTQGVNSVAITLERLTKDYENQVIKYGAGIGGEAFVKILGQIYNATSGQLKSLQSSISGASAALSPASIALSHLNGIFKSLHIDYTQSIIAINSASDQDYGSMLQLLNIQDAHDYWMDAMKLAEIQFATT